MVFLLLALSSVEELPARVQEPPTPRAFRMGFTAFPHDHTPEAFLETRDFVHANADLIAHHIEGVPWAETHAGGPLPAKLLEDWNGKKSMTPKGAKVYLAVSPGRGELKVHDKAGPLPAALKGKGYDHPDVKTAYLRYCRKAVEFFKPDYLVVGIEVNELSPAAGRAYADLHRHVYAALKKDAPALPVSASFTLHNLFKKRGAMLDGLKALMPHNDQIAVSYYPFFVGGAEALGALDWLVREFDGLKKPYAFVETNEAAERLPLPQAGVVIEGSAEKQRVYTERLLALAQERRFDFVVCFIHRDYDALWEKIKAVSPELFMAWRDCGLVDEAGKPRPAYHVWRKYFEVPLAP
ncbi:MAG TPA: hypothetical protein VF950_17225 [Planctomycetota bacterium]